MYLKNLVARRSIPSFSMKRQLALRWIVPQVRNADRLKSPFDYGAHRFIKYHAASGPRVLSPIS